MLSSVSAFFTWLITYLPEFLMSHPIVDILGCFLAVWVIAVVFGLCRGLRF